MKVINNVIDRILLFLTSFVVCMMLFIIMIPIIKYLLILIVFLFVCLAIFMIGSSISLLLR